MMKMKAPTSAAAAKAAQLRAQLQIELQNKKQCAYQPYECTQLTLDGYNYCLRHILEDKSAPFRPCSFVYTNNGKRCYLPAPKGDKKEFGYCNEHALKTHLNKTKQGARYPPPKTAEVLLHSLSHYVKKPRLRTVSSTTQHSDEGGRNTPDEGESKVTKTLDPFLDIDAYAINGARSDILDMCSESESDVDAATTGTVWPDAQADSSDNESIDSDQEDPLKHANVYTAEEITLMTRDKLKKLQSLYMDQYKHLQYILKEKRRKYLHNLKREKETYCSIHNQIRDNAKEQRLYKKLKAYNQYHKKNGVEAILAKRVHDMRMKLSEGVPTKPPTYSKCAYTEGGVKCGERALPVARHCRKHILEDPNQVLFRACGKMRADVECTTPVEAIFDDMTCPLHMDIPPIRSYSQIRKDSESDYDDSLDTPNMNLHNLCNNSNTTNQFLIHELGSIKKQEKKESPISQNSHSHSQLFDDLDNENSGLFGFDLNAEIKEECMEQDANEDLLFSSLQAEDIKTENLVESLFKTKNDDDSFNPELNTHLQQQEEDIEVENNSLEIKEEALN